MAGNGSYGSCRWIALAVLVFAGSGTANAGADEDYAAGMVAYQRTDFFVAVPLLRKAADAGHVEAAAVLGTIYDGAEQDEQAYIYYKKAADAGNTDGMIGQATLLLSGEVVPKDVDAAKALIFKAANAGNKIAVQILAESYLRGGLGIPEADRKGPDALKWITAAAELSFIPALETLQQAYLSGDYGLVVDPAKSEEMRQRILSLKPPPPQKKRRRG
jgi:TPR repeat protein